MAKNSNKDIDEIRKLMFGDTIKSYTNKIHVLEKSLQSQINQLNETLKVSEEDIKSKLHTEIKNKSQLNLSFTQDKITHLEEHHHELIYRKYKHMRASFNKLKEDIVELQKKQNSKIEKLKVQLRNDLQKEIRSQFTEIEKNYISKQNLSDILLQISEAVSS